MGRMSWAAQFTVVNVACSGPTKGVSWPSAQRHATWPGVFETRRWASPWGTAWPCAALHDQNTRLGTRGSSIPCHRLAGSKLYTVSFLGPQGICLARRSELELH
jgi:hypothetical protein